VGHRADIYSLGVVFYEMLMGELPLGRFPAPSETKGVDPRLDSVVFRTLEKQHERRYQSAGEMKTQVEQVNASPPPMPLPPPPLAADVGTPWLSPERVSQKAVWGLVCTVSGVMLVLGGMLAVRIWSVHGVERRSRVQLGVDVRGLPH